MIDYKKMINKKITISGFAEKIRNLQWVQFIVLRNEGERIQITIEKSDEKNAEMVKKVDTLTCESTIKVTGTIKENDHVKMGGIELIPDSIEITSISEAELPINIFDKINTTVVESPMPSPLIADEVTARVGHIPSIMTNVGFSFMIPLCSRSVYLFIPYPSFTVSL